MISAVMLAACFSAVGEGGGAGGGGQAGGAGAAGGGDECQADADCGRGNVCEPCLGTKSCTPGCRSDADCGRPMTCLTGVQCKTCPCPSGFCAIDPCLDVDGDGFVSGAGTTCSGKSGGDCDDADAALNPGATERCSNGRDDDCDGRTDANDPDCLSCTGQASGCGTAFDCRLGQTFCDKNGTSACCAACPQFEGQCLEGNSPVASGIDPLTGCARVSCIPDDGLGCTKEYRPVCGTNGQTYGNACELSQGQGTLLHPGECLPGEGLECGFNGPQACGTSGGLYCRDACPLCDAWVMRCTKVGVCVYDDDCPAGAPPPPTVCPDGSNPRASCVSHACQYSCP